ncbi:hypothetical protein D1007_09206 [Hordeum vulgare]|nr:hypothetical protein D1007_09206 [Hordeum vulgare]
MKVKEFLVQRLVPLHAHSRPLWDYEFNDDQLKLRSRDLSVQELSRVVATLLGDEPGDLPEGANPMYLHDNRANLVAALPVFGERWLFPPEDPSLVEVSLGNTSGGGYSERTVDDCPASAPPLLWADLLRELDDDDDVGEAPCVLTLGQGL